MSNAPDPIDAAIYALHYRRRLQFGVRSVVVACLLRTADWRPLKASWWRGKQVSLIGVDLDGNFFLRHSDGSVRYWDHRSQSDEIVAPSVHAFASALEEDDANAV